ncbi:phosphatidylinositol 3 and 4-kinase-domain-containing protein [Catenaria anguillulae PL171]|uniref:Phosphatidylinositol 4-kinase n=1 Tax=Catenaria anguillulae PL171 TaxID=765915 RepID=A0A1Y2HT76_9FUNG|nr:phosphatidylinositol 3 and 4-kinase-domain-containing protein [Catenaria anguillulae PL171]
MSSSLPHASSHERESEADASPVPELPQSNANANSSESVFDSELPPGPAPLLPVARSSSVSLTDALAARPLSSILPPLPTPRPLGLAGSYSTSQPPIQSASAHGTNSQSETTGAIDPALAVSLASSTSMASSSASLPTSSLNPESSDTGTGNASTDIHPGSLDLLPGGSSASLPIFGELKPGPIPPGESTSALGSITAINDPTIPPTMLQSLDALSSSHMLASASATHRKITASGGAIDVVALTNTPTSTAQRPPNTRMRGGSAEDSNGTASLIHLAMAQSTDSVLFAPVQQQQQQQQQQHRVATIDRLPTVVDSIPMSPTSAPAAPSANGPLATLIDIPSTPTPSHAHIPGQHLVQMQQANGLPTPTSPPTTLLGAAPQTSTVSPTYLHSPSSVPLPPSRSSSNSHFPPSTPIPPVPPLPTWLSPTKPTSMLPTLLSPCIDPVSATDFAQIVDSIRDAIQEDAQPMRIGQGSSGSYFCRNTDGLILGVFKPKDEEPYGELNPKWTKWIHRNVFFCCFGRSCLIPNVGYMSEAGASLLDQRLGFGIVPLTKVVSLASPAFYYRKRHRRHPQALPMKSGSLQLFLRGFKDASMFLKIHPLPDKPPNGSVVWEVLAAATVVSSSGSGTPPEEQEDDRQQGNDVSADVLPSVHASTEALVVNAATMSHDPAAGGETRINIPSLPPSPLPGSPVAPGTAGQAPTSPTRSGGAATMSSMRPLLDTAAGSGTYAGYQGIWDAATYDSFLDQFQRLTILDYLMRNTDRGLDNWMIKFVNGRIQVAAIDHGLAFPFKHPDKWRSYPYGWLYMSISKLPYLPHLRTYMTTCCVTHAGGPTRAPTSTISLHKTTRLTAMCLKRKWL